MKNLHADDFEIEQMRIDALHRYRILDTPKDGAFDKITHLAAQLLHMPVAIASLVDSDRIWFKSAHGIDAQQIERAPGLCASAILEDVPYVVSSARIDPRTLANPLVNGELGVQFYAAAPLQTHDGHNLGTLCVLDFKPRDISASDIAILTCLAGVIMDQIELRLAARHIDELNAKLSQACAALEAEVAHDALTTLLSRSAILGHLDKFLALSRRQDQPLALMLIDIDFFKKINDTHGHFVGDQVLVEVAKRIRAGARTSDSVGRIGGEEFMLVMYPGPNGAAETVAQRILAAVGSAPIVVSNEQQMPISIAVHISAGLFSTDEKPGAEAPELLNIVDRALYASKNNGRNRMTMGKPTRSDG